jgi:hypothetical protein
LLERDRAGIGDLGDDVADLSYVTDDFAAERFCDQLFGNDAGGDPRHRLSSARPPTAAVVAKAVLLVVGVVGVPGPVLVLDVRVVLALLVGVAHQNRDAGAGGAPLENASQDFGLVLFFALRDDVTLTGAAAHQVDAQIVL